MIAALLATAVLVRQNPNPSCVALPPGWKEEWGSPRAHNQEALVGPEGEEILFSAYNRDMEPADQVHRRNPKALYVAAFLGGRDIQSALSSDGTLTVTFGQRSPEEHASDSPVDYVTKATTARQAAIALTIMLTRLRAPQRDPLFLQDSRRSPDAPSPSPEARIPGDFFHGSVRVPVGYAYEKRVKPGLVLGSFVSRTAPALEMKRVLVPKAGVALARVSRGPSWPESAPMLDGKLNVRIEEGVRLTADFEPPEGRVGGKSYIAFVSTATTPAAATAAIFAALTYRP